jgi:chromosome segregation ATPase
MRTVSNFLSRAGVTSISETLAAPAGKQQSTNRSEDHGKVFTTIGARIGEDNETLRNLLIDAGHQFSALDDLKGTLGKLVEPLHKLMDALEREKSDNASLRGTLAESRANHETLRTEFQRLGQKSSELEDDNERLRRDLAAAQRTVGEHEVDNAKLGDEIATLRLATANLERQLGEENSAVRALGDEKLILLERAGTADRRIVELEAETALARERLSLLENEKNSLQTALGQTLSEAARTSRLLAESENVLSDTRARLQQAEISLAAAEDERKRLSAACEESNDRRQTEVYALNLKHDAIRSRSAAAEKLLAEVRQNLVARSEAIRIVETKLMEATIARNAAQKKTERLSVVTEAQERQIKKLEQAHLSLAEQHKVVSETARAREGLLAHAEEKIKSLTDRIERFRLDAAANQAKADKRIEELSAVIERERAEHAVAQGALETTRENYDQIQRKMSAERATRRHASNGGDKIEVVPLLSTTVSPAALNGNPQGS